MKHFNSSGVDIAYSDESPDSGRPTPVLLIHGFASNTDTNWVSTGWVKDLLAAGFRVIAMDNRGHGRSGKPHDPASYGATLMADDALNLLDHLGVARAHVIGYSMGARIAAFLALRHPKRVASLVFGGLGINMVRGMAGTGPIAHALEAESLEDVKNPTARTFRVFAEQTKSDLKALAACIRSSRDPITRDALATLTCPVLVAVGSEDVVGGSGPELAAIIPNAEAYVIEGRDHMKAVGDPKHKAAVLEFLGRDR